MCVHAFEILNINFHCRKAKQNQQQTISGTHKQDHKSKYERLVFTASRAFALGKAQSIWKIGS